MKKMVMAVAMVLMMSVSVMAEDNLEWPSYENANWADARAVTACGVSFIFGMDEGFGTMTLSQIRKLTELENFRRTWMVGQENSMLCEMANRLLPEYFGPFYDKFMGMRYPNGWMGQEMSEKMKHK